MLLVGKVHFDKFIVDLALMLGRNLVNLEVQNVYYIYRKSYLAMTHRFEDDMHFIEERFIETPFDIQTILNASRDFGTSPTAPVIIPS